MDDPIASEVRFAKSGNTFVAYKVFGNGPVNLVMTPGAITHLEYIGKLPQSRRWLEQVAQFARVAIFDKRGTGMSDRSVGIPTYEERMDDIRAVMDAAGFEDAVLMGISEGAPMSILFAASYPARTRGLVVYGGEAKGMWTPDYPWEATKEQWEAAIERVPQLWGSDEWLERAVSYMAPSMLGNEEFAKWLGDMRRMGSSPGSMIAQMKSEMNMDVRSILPAIHVPTIVIHLKADRSCNVGEGRYIASHIPGAKMIELPGVDHLFWVDPVATQRILQEVRHFVESLKPTPQVDRVLTTVMFTDIEGSTKRATELGDERWQRVLEAHNTMAKREIEKFNGSLVKNTGDGVLATFDGPTRAIRCAWAITRSAKDLGIEVRAGVHTGECIIGPNDVSGIAIHMAARVMGEASGGEVLVSGTVKDLVYGSGVFFEDRGAHELKGIDERRQLFAVAKLS